MAIIAKNIRVGVENAPTEPKEIQKTQSFSELKKGVVEGNKKVVEKLEKPSKYIKKTEGDLVRHINTKSAYQKDMLDL